jgi:hypothetical protein
VELSGFAAFIRDSIESGDCAIDDGDACFWQIEAS